MSLNTDLPNQGLQCKCPRDTSLKIGPDMKEYGEIRVHYAASSYSNQKSQEY